MIRLRAHFYQFIFISLTLFIVNSLTAGDWPMWRYDANRSASSSDSIADEKPNVLWQLSLGARQQVWDSPLNNYLMQYDKVFEPIVSGQTLIIGFNDSDKIVGIDTASGKVRWTYFTDGPIRLAPVAHKKKVYFGSDDGFFYCLDIAKGKEVWKFRAAPTDKRLIGNRRVISMWPVRGGPVIEDDTVYFSAGIWPFMGVFIYALDAETGKVVWLNDDDSIKYREQPHKPSMAFAGVAPQGAFAVNEDKLIVPGGRSLPAILDRNTGAVLKYDFDKYSKLYGGDFVASVGDVYYMRYRDNADEPGMTQFSISKGTPELRRSIKGIPVIDEGVTYFSGSNVSAYETDQDGVLEDEPLWSVKADASGDLIKAGSRLYAGGENSISAIDIEGKSLAWIIPVTGNVSRLIAADKKLFAVTADGRIMALGEGSEKPVSNKKKILKCSTKDKAAVETILMQTKSKGGWALVNGLDNLSLAFALSEKASHNILILDPSRRRVDKTRHSLDDAGLYGTRISVHYGTPSSFNLAPYSLELAITSKQPKSADLEQLLKNLRPYGGSLIIRDKKAAPKLPEGADDTDYVVSKTDVGTVITRPGALKGAAPWTHNYGSIAQTAKSDDRLVKLPLGILWWGGSSNMDVLPRHAHGPSEQVIGGKLFIQGINSMSARDVYTGRVIWKRELPGLNESGVYFDDTYKPNPLDVTYNQKHIPGANVRGANFVATRDELYLIFDDKCLVLDCDTGKTINTFYLPGKAKWGYIGVQGDLLIAGAGFSSFVETKQSDKKTESNKPTKPPKVSNPKAGTEILNKSASRKLVVMNRHDGSVTWEKVAEHGFIHNGIAASEQMLFVLDRVPTAILDDMKRHGEKEPAATISAFDLKTGKEVWSKSHDVFGSFLSYSSEHQILLHSSRPSRDMFRESGKEMLALKADTGETVWRKDIEYETFPILHGDYIISESGKWNLLTGRPATRINPITGEEEGWTWTRTYGCNYPVASEHMLTFRSGAASFYDLQGDGGTGSFGGFKSGCSINLIAADGVLSAPDYTLTCNCSYQNQTSLALVHMPEHEFWTSSTIKEPSDETINRIGLNLGAPGDRKDGKTYWVDYPSIGGESPDPSVEINDGVSWHLDNATRFGSSAQNWIYSSCAEGLTKLTIKVNANKATYTVALYFAEPEELQEGKRVFDVSLQGTEVISQLDVVREAGSARKGITKLFKGIKCNGELTVSMQPKSSKGAILSGMEIIKE